MDAEDNALAIESGIKTEMAESVRIGWTQTSFLENYIDVPDEKVDLVDEMTGQLNTMESKLNESIEENVGLTKQSRRIYQEWDSDRDYLMVLVSLRKRNSLSNRCFVEFENEESFRRKSRQYVNPISQWQTRSDNSHRGCRS